MLTKLNADRLWSYHSAVVQAEIQLAYAYTNNTSAIERWLKEVEKARARLAVFIKAQTAPEMVKAPVKESTRDHKLKYHRPSFKGASHASV